MEERTKTGKTGLAAMKAGMDRKTAAKYLAEGKLPSELKQRRDWRTRPDPFEADWPAVRALLVDAPELEAKTLFEHLLGKHPGRYEPGQLRTLQRRVQEWRAKAGPEKEVYFAQEHRPGEAMQTDFTNCNELAVTIAGEAFEHLLCHPVLPYSNWEWATICHSESLLALRRGVQSALFRLGKVPRVHQTDNSTAATHQLGERAEPDNERPDEAKRGRRGFNDEYQRLMDHFGMQPRTIEVGKSNQNGDAEALNGVLKRRLEQHLLMRGSRDFDSPEAYEGWVQEALEKANELRRMKVVEELAAMRDLQVARLPECVEETATVTSWSTIRVRRNTYSVPSRLIGHEVRVSVFEDRLEIRYGGTEQLSVERLRGEGGRRINYRHIIWSLVQKPYAFARYKYREELFPSVTFRRAYDALVAGGCERDADREYLRILHLAATTMESQVEAVLELLLTEQRLTSSDPVKALVAPKEPAEVPSLQTPQVDLSEYDGLLSEEVAS
jgi:transposase InsO family protein